MSYDHYVDEKHRRAAEEAQRRAEHEAEQLRQAHEGT
jgi:hypothetical protein